MNKRKRKCPIVTFGLGGHSMALMPDHGNSWGGTLSGYEDPETFCNRMKAGDYTEYDVEGAIVVDERGPLDEKPSLSFRSPLINPTIQDGAIDRCPDPDPIFASAVAGNEFGTLIALQSAHRAKSTEPGPLDSIGPAAYREW